MRYTYFQATLWGLLYAAIALSPLALMLVEPRASGRGFWMDFGVAIGFVGLAMLALQFVITGRFRNFAMGFGSDNILQFHLATGVVAMGFVLLHPVIIIAADTQFLSYFDPTVNFMRAFALVGAVIGAVLLVVLSLWRQKFRIIYEWWRLTHGALAFLVLLAALVHTLQVSHFTAPWWKKGVVIVFAGGAILLLLHTRLVKPLILKKNPYRVAEIKSERADATTLVIEAVDHEGMHFEAGQYAWITIGDSPFSLQQHPFSFSSSADEPTRLEFTSKPLGDWTETWPDVEPGANVYLEGPYGAFTIHWDSPCGAVFLAGGIGVTPIMSILRTLADRGDERPYLLIYANTSWEGVIYREEIKDLEQRLNLSVVHVLEEPPDDWEGEEGFVDPDVLDRHLPEDQDQYFYYLCGPEPMMDMVEPELVSRDIPLPMIKSERFEIV
jgi:predicted ferric reductase